jgi:hypothetical protein
MTEGFDHSYDMTLGSSIPKVELTQAHIEGLMASSAAYERATLSTDTIDKPKTISAINSLYRLKGLQAPEIIWAKSPMAIIFEKILRDLDLGLDSNNGPWGQITFDQEVPWGEHLKTYNTDYNRHSYYHGEDYMVSLYSLLYYFRQGNKAVLNAISGTHKRWLDYWSLGNAESVRDLDTHVTRHMHDVICYLHKDSFHYAVEDKVLNNKTWNALCEDVTLGLCGSPSNAADDPYLETGQPSMESNNTQNLKQIKRNSHARCKAVQRVLGDPGRHGRRKSDGKRTNH